MKESEFRQVQCPWCGNKFMFSLGKQMPKCPRCGRRLTMNDSVHQLTIYRRRKRLWWF